MGAMALLHLLTCGPDVSKSYLPWGPLSPPTIMLKRSDRGIGAGSNLTINFFSKVYAQVSSPSSPAVTLQVLRWRRTSLGDRTCGRRSQKRFKLSTTLDNRGGAVGGGVAESVEVAGECVPAVLDASAQSQCEVAECGRQRGGRYHPLKILRQPGIRKRKLRKSN